MSIRDPIHGSIGIDDWALALIGHPVFQRLRRVKQLGTAELVYPGAHHNRFEHSLGAHYLAGQLAEGLSLDESDALTLRAAALLHDVGHGPFSHAFEEIIKEEGRAHEGTTVDLVRWGPLGDLLRQHGLDPVAVSEAVVGEGKLSSIVSGALDADRMDYLLRDAHYTGVRCSVDPGRLCRVIERGDEGVLVRESGILAAEGLLTTRFLMYPAVYYHHTVRASEAILLEAIRTYMQETEVPMEALEQCGDEELLHRIRSNGGVGASFVKRLDERRLYKRAYEGRELRAGELDSLLRPGAKMKLRQDIADGAGVDIGHVLLDIPKPPKFRETNLHVKLRSGDVVPMRDASQLVNILHEARMDHWRHWVFAPKEHAEAVGRAAEKELGPLARF